MKKKIFACFAVFLLFGIFFFVSLISSENAEVLEHIGDFGEVEVEGKDIIVNLDNGGARIEFREGAVVKVGEQEFRDISSTVGPFHSHLEIDAEGKITSARFVYQGEEETTYDFVGLG